MIPCMEMLLVPHDILTTPCKYWHLWVRWDSKEAVTICKQAERQVFPYSLFDIYRVHRAKSYLATVKRT